MDDRNKQIIGNSRVYASKLEAGIRNAAVGIGLTAQTRGEAVTLVKGALSVSEKEFMSEPGEDGWSHQGAAEEVKREEYLGSSLADLYTKTRERMPGPNPENEQKIARRMKYTAGVLAEAYHSPTCSSEVRQKIDAIVKQERNEDASREHAQQTGISPETSRSFLASAMDETPQVSNADNDKISEVSNAVEKLRRAGFNRGMLGQTGLKAGEVSSVNLSKSTNRKEVDSRTH